MRHDAPTGEAILRRWHRLRRWPGGRWLFARGLFRMAPYSGSIGARIVELGPGYARLSLRDRRPVRNHLRSIHAAALANLGELATGMAVNLALPAGTRGILTRLSVEYVKKARGPLSVVCDCSLPAITRSTEVDAVGEISDEQGELVARAVGRWRISPVS